MYKILNYEKYRVKKISSSTPDPCHWSPPWNCVGRHFRIYGHMGVSAHTRILSFHTPSYIYVLLFFRYIYIYMHKSSFSDSFPLWVITEYWIESLCYMIVFIDCVCVCPVAQSCPTLCDPMDCSPPGSSVHVILQTRILGWVASSFSRDQNFFSCVSCIGRRILDHCPTWEGFVSYLFYIK